MSLQSSLRGFLPPEIIEALQNEITRSDTALVRSGYADIYIGSSAGTTTDQEPNFTKVAGTYATARDPVGFTHSAGVLTLTDPETRIYQVTASITVVATANDTYAFRVALNGTSVSRSEQRRVISGVADVGSVSLVSCFSLAPGDTLEIQTAREGGVASTLTAQRLNVMVQAIS
jgi:hypothetical protein